MPFAQFSLPHRWRAPKVRAVELIAELEGEKRGVYAGAVEYFGYNSVSLDGPKIHDGTVGT
jgi:anthranilate synthase component 1